MDVSLHSKTICGRPANHFWQAASAMFGLDEGNDRKRIALARKKLYPLLVNNPQIMTEVIRRLPEYAAWTASGEHRLMPVAAAIINACRGRRVFDRRGAEELQGAGASFAYLTQMHPYYANPFNLPETYLPPLSCQKIPLPVKRKMRLLDVATAPKEGGSPTLRMFQKALTHCLPEVAWELIGTDLVMPYYRVTADNKIELSEYLDPATGKLREETMLNGIRYCWAQVSRYNALSEAFFAGEEFDIITICMALHHLREPEESERPLALSSRKIINADGHLINNRLKISLAPSTQQVVNRLLQRLAPEGILFVNTFFPNQEMHLNSDMFWAVRRYSDEVFMLYDRAPIPFNPNAEYISPSRKMKLLGGLDQPLGAWAKDQQFVNPGIKSLYPGQEKNFYQKVTQLLDRTELLVLSRLRWGEGVWGQALKAIEAIKAGKSLPEILTAYLAIVPEGDHWRKGILEDAAALVEDIL